MLLRAIIFGAFFILPLLPYTSHAQVGGDITGITGAGVTIIIDPQYPSPEDKVTASIDDYSMNSSGATVTWFFDGLSAPAVTNQRKINFTAPEIGKKMKVVARLTFPDGRMVESERLITPLYLDLIIEPQTYTPAFYQGRALPTKGSLVYINALLQTEDGMVDSSQYSYNWTLNNKSVYGGAKQGGNWAEITVPHGLSNIVGVSIQDNSGTTLAKKLFLLPTAQLEVQFYELNTLLGLGTKAISEEIILTGNSTSIRAVPYYLDTRAIISNLFTEWSIDNQKVQTGNLDPFEINLTRGVAGKASVSFKIRNLNELLQSDERSFSLTF